MDKRILAIIGIVAVVAVAGGAAFMLMGGGQSSDINMPDDLRLPVVDPYDTTVPQEVIDDAAITNPSIRNMTKEQISDSIKELQNSQSYQQKVKDLSANTNKQVESALDRLNKSYEDLNNYVRVQCSNVTEKSLTGNSAHISAVDIYSRDDEDTFVVYLIKSLQQIDSIQRYGEPLFVAEITEKFPRYCDVLRQAGYEITVDIIRYAPKDVSSSALHDAHIKDVNTNGGTFITDYPHGKYRNLLRSYNIEKDFTHYLDKFTKLLTLEQASGYQKLLDASNEAYEEYVSIIADYNESIRNLQTNYLKNL